ncbi:MAG TPA: ABC transporter permease subunit [Bacteroidia bacterium]|nr:ABC transporter permease subunit [Bacteroidia bacterium]
MNRIIKYVVLDIVKNRIVLAYTLVLATLSWSVFALEDNSSKGLLTLLNVILLIVPLVALLFSTIYLYNSSEFVELLLSQPIRRNRIWRSLFSGLSGALLFSFLVGTGIPLFIYAPPQTAAMMVLMGSLLSCVFVAMAFFSSIFTRDKTKGIGIAILLWLFFALLFDGLLLFVSFQFADYPIEKMMVGISAFNPIDLARILILLDLDVSAMMGYTGAIFKDFFGNFNGMVLTIAILLTWILLPFWISLRRFIRKDL